MATEKLALNKETLRQLGDDELKQVAGGTFHFDWLLDVDDWLLKHLFNNWGNKADNKPGEAATANPGCSCSQVTVTTTGP